MENDFVTGNIRLSGILQSRRTKVFGIIEELQHEENYIR